MRAAILHEGARSLEITDVDLDKAIGREVRVRVVNSGLCHSDLHFIDGTWPARPPMLLGHEAAGIVEAVGPDVTEVAPGDHVISCLSAYCGRCIRCRTGHTYLCQRRDDLGHRPPDQIPRVALAGQPVTVMGGLGSFAEEMVVHENAVVKIRDDMPFDRAALIGCAVTTGTGAVFRSAGVGPGETVAVIGCGGVGISAVQGAAIAGAGRIFAVDVVPQKLAWAAEMGATDTVDSSSTDAVAEILAATAGGVDYSFEAIGLKETAEQAFAMIRPGGLATVMGMIPPSVKLEISGIDLFYNAKRLQGSLMGSNMFKVDMPRLIDLYLDGRLKLDEMISQHIALEQINEGFDAMVEGRVVRSVIDIAA